MVLSPAQQWFVKRHFSRHHKDQQYEDKYIELFEEAEVPQQVEVEVKVEAKSGQRFYCELCSASYIRKNHLKRHFMDNHHGHRFNSSVERR